MAVREPALFADIGWWCAAVVLLWTPSFVQSGQYDNVALNKPCTMSSSWFDANTQTSYGTDLAVDGQKGGFVSSQCVHSGAGDRNGSWEVDLQGSYSIHRMISYARSSFEGRMDDVVVTVDGQPCFTYASSVSNRIVEFSCTDGVKTGARVRLNRPSTGSNAKFINFCEFEVLTCKDFYWGPTCDDGCGSCSLNAPVCDKVTGICPGACQPGWKPSTPNRCDQMCDSGTYGANCASACSPHCNGNVCNNVNGYCTCDPGYQGDRCDQVCDDGSYGPGCAYSCGPGCRDTCNKVTGTCNKVTGTCNKVTGTCNCEAGWQPPLCNTPCQDGKYGLDCAQDCSSQCSNVCDKKYGNCTCNAGYQAPLCVVPCSAGWWGQGCSQRCSDNCADVCDHVTGQCTCKPGWKGSRCQNECNQGTYGQDCKVPCGNCQVGTFCHHVTGHCSQCQQFYQLPLCTECEDYKYGPGCSQDCSANCQGVCDKAQGDCTCVPGWQEPRCVQECTDGTYGLRCGEKCGNCSDGRTSCDHVNGHCPRGCLSGWGSPLCQLPLQDRGGGGGGGGGGGSIGGIVGAVSGVVVSGAVAAVVVFIIRRRRGLRAKRSSESLESPPSAIINGGSDNRKKKQASFSNRDDIYQNVTVNPQMFGDVSEGAKKPEPKSKPMVAVKPKVNKSASPSDTGSASIYQNSPTFNTPSRPPSTSNSRPSLPATSSHEADAAEAEEVDDDHTQGDVYYNDDTYMTSEAVQLGLDSVQEYLLGRLRFKDLDAEFEKLEKGLARGHVAGSADENYYKNRFKTILPYDDNRVHLRNAPHPGANDYVNASFVRGWKSEKAYIASQGPRPNTMEDMWWMMWQEGVTHVVMLTSVMEADKKKCEEYWPGLGVEKKYGAICVVGTGLHARADYVIRTFDVKAASGGSSRKVTQFHFVTWQDHDVPSVTSLVDFLCSVSWSYRNEPTSTAPLLVHCSAGVGRTGAFIALDFLMQQTRQSKSVNVQQTAAQLRHDRCNMIQTKAQYRLVYEAFLEAYTSRGCRAPVSSVDTLPPVDSQSPCPPVDPHFQKLQQMKVLLKKPCHRVAEDEANINKNRDISVLPDDNHVVFLTYHIRGRNQYINAVYTSTFFKRRGCIMTQLPLRDTVIDFWRLVTGDDVKTVISLGTEVEKFEPGELYWPAQEGQSQTHGPFKVMMNSLTSLGPRLSSYHITLTPEGGKARDVRLLHYSGWPDQLPEEMTDLLQLLCIMTEQDARNEKGHPLLLQCRDGAVRSGLVRVIADVISRMTSDGHVDVYTAVKRVQTVRPQCVTKIEEYRFIYSVLQSYQQSSNVYQNT